MTEGAAQRYGIGIDTGGTYTDAVMMLLDTNEVIEAVKVPTTHADIQIGVAQALEALLDNAGCPPEQIKLIAVSTTLATNAVLENTGGQVGFFSIGNPSPLDLPVLAQHFVTGGHTIGGTEIAELDLEALLEGVQVMRKCGVDTYAVCGAMSMENASHELVAAKAIAMVDPKPVFCSHQCSDKAGFKDRAATAVLNAKLMPVMQCFVEGVEASIARLGISCETIMIRGDATPLPMQEGPMQAASTVGSGPAATTWFGMEGAGVPDAVVVDVGGTSTDVTMLQAGKPVIAQDGERIGDLKTHVRAVAMHTAGVGGDSHACFGKSKKLKVGPRRVTPLCLAGDALPDPMDWLGADQTGKCLMLEDGGQGLEAHKDDPIVRLLREKGPCTPETVSAELRFSAPQIERSLDALVRNQVVKETGFTPTDALHALGRMDMGNGQHSVAGARAMGRVLGIKGEEICGMVLNKAQETIEDAILHYMLQAETSGSMSGILERRREFKHLGVHFTLNMPIIGVGAAASLLLPGVAESLQSEAVFPRFFQVGNAYGALLIALAAMANKE